MLQYFIIYKPFQVLSQFTSYQPGTQDKTGKTTLKDLFTLPDDIYPVGRLDYDSEGLLILTNDTQLNHRLLNPSFAHEREYWVQVEGVIDEHAMDQLRSGVLITIDGKPYRTGKCIVEPFDADPGVPERVPPIRFRKSIPTSWIRLIIHEGKNRQVRKMTARTGFPTLRLIRFRIARLTLEGMNPGQITELSRDELYKRLFHEA